MAGSAGYSGTPLLKKLGYTSGQRACLVAVPAQPTERLSFSGFATRRLIKSADAIAKQRGPFDLVHIFTREAAMLAPALAAAHARLDPRGMVWVCWPKKAAKIETDVTENVIRRHALAAGLVDVKVCAIDAIWSGLKLVIPKAARQR
jgi:hypothetical protein